MEESKVIGVLSLASKKVQGKVLVKRVDSELGLLGLNSSSTLGKSLNLPMPQFSFLKISTSGVTKDARETGRKKKKATWSEL